MAVEIRLGRLTRCRRWCCRAGTAGAEEPEGHVPADKYLHPPEFLHLTEGCGQQDRVASAQGPQTWPYTYMGVSVSEEGRPIVLGQACAPRIR